MSAPPHIPLPASDAPVLPDWPCAARVTIASESAMDALAVRLCAVLQTGDTVLLSGAVGAGKTHLARAMIRTWLASPSEPVPSPTFTLVQTYGADPDEVFHADLYRLGDASELTELGLDEAMQTALCLIEWPDKLAPDWPLDAALLHLERHGDETRDVAVLAPEASALGARLATVLAP